MFDIHPKPNADRFLAQLLIPINLNKLKQEDELHIYDAYRADLQTQQQFILEAKGWKARCDFKYFSCLA
jgi:hypothetical protein